MQKAHAEDLPTKLRLLLLLGTLHCWSWCQAACVPPVALVAMIELCCLLLSAVSGIGGRSWNISPMGYTVSHASEESGWGGLQNWGASMHDCQQVHPFCSLSNSHSSPSLPSFALSIPTPSLPLPYLL